MKPLVLTPLDGIPDIMSGDDIADILLRYSSKVDITIQNGDIFVITQKIISKSENRMVNLQSISPSQRAYDVSKLTKKDPRLVQLILNESKEIVRCRQKTLIVEHRLGFICANAGIDHSNVKGHSGKSKDWYLLLPENPDLSASKIRKKIEKSTGKKIGIMIIDSHGRAWRMGVIGTCIGISGVPALVDLRGKNDLYGYKLRITQVAAADELASAASLLMGEADESIPIVHVRGFPYKLRESSLGELIRNKKRDLFR